MWYEMWYEISSNDWGKLTESDRDIFLTPIYGRVKKQSK